MATTTMPHASTSTSVTTAAKRPAKTKTFLARLRTALIIFDDQISSLDEVCATTYDTFIMAYKEAFAEIWPKIEGADVTILLQSVKDTELQELCHLSQILCPDKAKPTLVQEKCNVPTLDNILGSLVNRIPEQKLPGKETCSLISDIFSDLAEAHKYYANVAKGLADNAGLILPEQLTLVLAAAVPPTLQLVLPPGQISPLSTPPPPPETSTTHTGQQELFNYCKNKILPNPSAAVFQTCEARTPTRVLVTAVFCTLEKHLFDDTTPRAEVASNFCITAAQLHKSITGVDYKSGPHVYKKKHKTTDTASSTSKIQKTAPGPSSVTEETSQTQETSQEPDDDDTKTGPIPAEDTLSSASSDSLYNPFN